MPQYRSRTTTHGRNMAGARALWRATGMKDGDFDKPIIAISNSFTQFVPGHVHLKDMAQLVARQIEKAGGAIGLVEEGDTIGIDIPNRSINLKISDAGLATRRTEMEEKGKNAWKPVDRDRQVSPALRAYAAMSTSAAFGAVRDVSQIEKG